MNTDQYQQQRKKAGTDARFDGRRSNREKGKRKPVIVEASERDERLQKMEASRNRSNAEMKRVRELRAKELNMRKTFNEDGRGSDSQSGGTDESEDSDSSMESDDDEVEVKQGAKEQALADDEDNMDRDSDNGLEDETLEEEITHDKVREREECLKMTAHFTHIICCVF
jgi:hypothetical protein